MVRESLGVLVRERLNTAAPVESVADLLQASVAGSGRAALICDQLARVVFFNDAAEALLARPDGVSLVDDRIAIADSTSRQRFHSLLRASAEDCASPAASAMLVARPSGLPAYQLLVRALGPADDSARSRRMFWSLSISDPCGVDSGRLQTIAELYGLTRAETRLAQQLMLGATVEEAAGALYVSIATIRSHLSSLLRKTGARRQAQLVRLLSAVPA